VCVCVSLKHHTDVIKDKKRTVKQIKKSIAQMVEKNDALLAELERLNVSVNERRHIDETSGKSVSQSICG
jgi:regulator of replication initiation timing